MDNTTVKLDSALLKSIKELLKQEKYRFKYVNLKHFVNIAVVSLIEKEKKGLGEGWRKHG